MEETNYHRTSLSGNMLKTNTAGASSPVDDSVSNDLVTEKDAESGRVSSKQADSPSETGTKSYAQKLKVFEKEALNYPNRMGGMIIRPLIFLLFPVISYSGFCYGSNLVWFNVLNGTASLILSKPPYGFSSSMVGLSYLSPLIGVAVA